MDLHTDSQAEVLELTQLPYVCSTKKTCTCPTYESTCAEHNAPLSIGDDSSSSAKSTITFTFEAAYTKDEFLALGLQEKFAAIFAEIAGVEQNNVVIKALQEIALRYNHRDELSLPKRRLLSASVNADVEITVPTHRAKDAVSKLTEANINQALENERFPKLIAVSEAQVQDTPQKSSSSTLQGHGSLLGFALLFFTVFQVYG